MCELDWSAIAAWVQAIGSIIAIAAAIWIGDRASKRSRNLVEQERKRQADIFASTLSTRIGLQAQEAAHKAKHATHLANKQGDTSNPDANALKALFLLPYARDLIEQRRDCLLFDRDTGVMIVTALDVLGSYNPPVETMIDMYAFRAGEHADLRSLCTEIAERLQFIAKTLRDAENRLESVHGLEG